MRSDPIETDGSDYSDWVKRDLPDDPREAFRIINEWAKSLQEWNTRVRSMCAIVEERLDLSPGQFKRVVDSVKADKHSKADVRLALGTTDRVVAGSFVASDLGGKAGSTGVTGATDVVGHPPDPPFTDPPPPQ